MPTTSAPPTELPKDSGEGALPISPVSLFNGSKTDTFTDLIQL